MKKFFFLYDGRARCGDTDEAMVCDSAETEVEVRDQSDFTKKHFPDGVWFEYDCDGEGNLSNEQMRLDLSPELK